MHKDNLNYYFLLFLTVVILGLSAYIFWPFFSACILAIVFGVVFDPLHKKILAFTHGRQKLSAFLSVLFVIILVITPILFLGLQIFQEAQSIHISPSTDNTDGNIVSMLNELTGKIENKFPVFKTMSLDIEQYLQDSLRLFTTHLGSIFSSFAKLFADLFIFLFSLFYIFKDGHKMRQFVIKLSPLPDNDDDMILRKLSLAIHSVVVGSLLIAIIQGIGASIGFLLFGLPNAVFWGIVASFSALIPGIGTSLVLVPAIVYLFFVGHTTSAIGLLVWGALAVGLIDNLLGPKLVGRGMELHPQLVLISVLGGLIVFGPLGFLLGPLTLNLLFALLDIYEHVTKTN